MILLVLLDHILTIILHPVFLIAALAIAVFAKPSILTLFLWAAVPVVALVAFVYLGGRELPSIGTEVTYKPSQTGLVGSYIASLIWTGAVMTVKRLSQHLMKEKSS